MSDVAVTWRRRGQGIGAIDLGTELDAVDFDAEVDIVARRNLDAEVGCCSRRRTPGSEETAVLKMLGRCCTRLHIILSIHQPVTPSCPCRRIKVPVHFERLAGKRST